MRVCIVISDLLCGGAQKRATQLALGLKALGISVQVVVLNHDGFYGDTIRRAGIPLRTFAASPKSPANYYRLLQIFARENYDVVHSWLFCANVYGTLAAARARVPVIVTSEVVVRQGRRAWYHAIDRRLQHLIDAVVVNSPALGSYYHRHVGIKRSRLVLIPNAVAVPRDLLPKPTARRMLGLPRTGLLIGSVARMVEHKRLHDVIDALAILRGSGVRAAAAFAGGGPEEVSLRRRAELAGLGQHVFFLGQLTPESVGVFLRAIDIFVLPSEREGMSNALLEAMANELPVVVSDIPENRCVVADGTTGLLFPTGNAQQLAQCVVHLLRNQDTMVELGRRARRFVECHFSVERMTWRYASLYRSLFERKSLRRNGARHGRDGAAWDWWRAQCQARTSGGTPLQESVKSRSTAAAETR